MTFQIFHPNPDPTSNVRQSLVVYAVTSLDIVCLYVFGLGLVVVFSLPSVLPRWCCLVVLDKYSRA